MTHWELKAEGFTQLEEYFNHIVDVTDMGRPYEANDKVQALTEYQREQFRKYLGKLEQDQLFPVALDTFATIRRMIHNLLV